MRTDEIAKTFYGRGLANQWLTQRQTSWLYGQACREAGRKLTTHGTPTANGSFQEGEEMIGWEIAVSPRNGCAAFRTQSITALSRQKEEERARELESGRQFAQIVKNTPYADIHPPELIAQIYHVSVDVAKEWLA